MTANLSIKSQVLKVQVKNKRSALGFTLVELMIAISIIAIIAAVGLVTYSSAQKAGRISKRAQDLMALKTAMELYKTATGSYPTTTAAGGPASAGRVDTSLTRLVPNYMPTLPKDPVDNGSTIQYRYLVSSDGLQYKIYTANTPAGEMDSAAFRQQPVLIDPARDSGPNGCVVDPPAGSAVWAWAVYSMDSSTTTSCHMAGEPL